MAFTKLIAEKVADYDDRSALGSRLRAKRIAPFLQLIEMIEREHGHVNVIDIGGTERYWNIVPRAYLEDHRVKITIVNLSDTLPPDHGPFRFAHGDGCALTAFGDDSFHLVHSNSVIEHVGDWSRMVQFANEVRRLARRHFVQTPNFWFPIEPHFMTPLFHWLPRPTRVWLCAHFRVGRYRRSKTIDEAARIVDDKRLLSRTLLRALFPDSDVETERFFGLPKSLIAIRR
jgi:Methyltransferase domain